MDSIRVQCYLNRARDFLAGMNALLGEEIFVRENDLVHYRSSPALLGIHGAISYCDALRVGLGGDSLSSKDHRSALNDLKVLLSARNYSEPQGAERFSSLVNKTKSKVAYSDVALDEDGMKKIIQDAERFASWAEKTGRRLGIEGW